MRAIVLPLIGLGAACLAVSAMPYVLPPISAAWARAFPRSGFHDYAGTTLSPPRQAGFAVVGILLVAAGLSVAGRRT